MTPFEACNGKKPWVSDLRIFGCIEYALVNFHSKLDERSVKCILLAIVVNPKYIIYIIP